MSNARNLANLLNSSGVLTADAGVKADNITIDGTEIDLSSGDLTLDVSGDLIIDADGGDVKFKDGGVEFSQYYKDGNDLAIYSSISDGDIKFQGLDGSSVITPITIDMSEGGLLRIANTSGTLFNSSSATGTIAGTSLQVATSGSTVGFFNRLSSDGQILGFYKDGSQVGSIGNSGTDLFIVSTSSAGLLLKGSAVLPANSSGSSVDDDRDLGSSSKRWRDIYTNGAVTTSSDQNEKQDIANLSAKELKVANKLSALFKTYRWKDRVAEKGDKARTHSGIIAQDIQSAFSAEGLDASNYGMFISNTWWEKEISVDAVKADEEKGIEAKDAYTYMDTKDEKTDGYTEKTRLAVRYPELFSFIFSSIEARLTALESK